ncbi:hypothetical protein M885DRAFT_164671 [Pelagophyceae sp. CCMP2097]|nr:hypothetical protein M885DRAFT_164671 [Pelagophyceae sp. CCMP2097]
MRPGTAECFARPDTANLDDDSSVASGSRGGGARLLSKLMEGSDDGASASAGVSSEGSATPTRSRNGSSSTSSSPLLSLPESFDDTITGGGHRPALRRSRGGGAAVEAELRRHLEREMEAQALRHDRIVAARSRALEEVQRELDRSRALLMNEARALEAARAALKERRDVVEAGVRDGAVYAERASDGAAGDDASTQLVDEIRLRPPDELTLREFATLKAADAARDAHRRRAEACALLVAAEQRRDAADAAKAAAERCARQLRDELARSESELDMTRATEREQRLRLESASRAAADLAVASVQLCQVRAECDGLRFAAEADAETLRRASVAERDCGARVADAEKLCSLARADAQHQDAVGAAEKRRADREEQRAVRAEADVADVRAELQEAKRAHRALADEYDSRLRGKSDEVEAAAKAQLLEIRERAERLEDRELRALREARHDASQDAAREREARLRLDRDLAAARNALADAEARGLAHAAESGADRKIVAYEAARLRAELDEALRRGRRLDDENEMVREQLDVAAHDNDHIRATSAAEQRALAAHLSDARTKLAAYDALELELDTAVLRCADANASFNRQSGGDSSRALAAGLTRPERRVRQAVQLAQRLLQTEAELHTERARRDGAEAGAAAATAAYDLAKRRLAEASKPAQYLLKALSERDDSLEKLRVR